jgi:hypothetical protein
MPDDRLSAGGTVNGQPGAAVETINKQKLKEADFFAP